MKQLIGIFVLLFVLSACSIPGAPVEYAPGNTFVDPLAMAVPRGSYTVKCPEGDCVVTITTVTECLFEGEILSPTFTVIHSLDAVTEVRSYTIENGHGDWVITGDPVVRVFGGEKSFYCSPGIVFKVYFPSGGSVIKYETDF